MRAASVSAITLGADCDLRELDRSWQFWRIELGSGVVVVVCEARIDGLSRSAAS